MRKRTCFLVLVVLSFQAGAPAQSSEPPIDKETVRKAITIFRRTPANQQGSMVRPIILRFAQESPEVAIVVPSLIIPWIEGAKARNEAKAALLTAYVAGDLQSQLDQRKPKDDPLAGAAQVIATYRQLQQTEPQLRINEVEKLIDLQKQGKLAKHLGTPR